ncbi:hypothetical protein [Planomonospora parontospora]|uniref:hypothetical protein n=1 Tax=Planomonospora parontospora TaxID=58119 RepID=UPI0016713F2F|nr:hypothetical protein [Planomonospora parontospora]GGL24349.1 hypothetical protein GCM10014719_27550 [Planomonospora parontospora subsp. antibiotica]GII15117.1 hypothetical protein Ppa05_18430 [Planomonospora parontospora subsp. antibiotica]
MDTTNGTAHSRSYIGPRITAAYRRGAWDPVRPDPCGVGTGRRGQVERMVPEGPVSVVGCRHDPHAGRHPRTGYGGQVVQALATALNSLETVPSENQCQEIGRAAHDVFRLSFGYPDGPPAEVTVLPGCRPGVNNGLLQADLDGSVENLLVRLAPPD